MMILQNDMIRTLLLLGLGITLNILAGTLNATIKHEWNKEKMINGIKKGAVIVILTFGLAFMFSLDNAIEFNGVPIVEYLNTIYQLAYVSYAVQIVTKIAGIIQVETTEGE